MKNYAADNFIDQLRNADWSGCLNSLCINSAWKSFQEVFMSVLDNIAPVKEVRIKQRTEEWMTSDILDLIHCRDKFLYNFKKFGNHDDYVNFNKLRNKVQREIKRAKSEFFSGKIEENKKNPKKLWQHIKELGLKNKTNDGAKLCLKIANEICHEPKAIADHFVEFFFTNVASNLVSKLPTCSNIFSVNSERFKLFYSDRNVNNATFTLHPVSEDFIFKELVNVNPTKSTGLDDIPARFIKDGAIVLTTPITHIVNLSITSGVVPNDMKMARIKPLYKKNSPLDVGNYRPVSILSIVSKILERSVYTQLSEFLCENNLLFEFQSGFRDKYSTDTCLIHLLDYIRDNNTKGLYTGMVMLDLQKAFDTVDHNILCNKLEVLGVHCTEWFRSYLSDRI